MELKTKELFLSTLDGVMSVRQDCGLEIGKTEALKDAVENMPLLVPVVGEFSAGKSSILNTLMKKKVLAVAVKPETAIPAELYYSETEYDEGVRAEQSRAEQSRAEQSTDRLTNLSDAAGKYVCVKRHINSTFLRDIEPVVLVDMPGFDSPLDAHNKAIFNYLERGIHYAVLIPADAGTVSKSMERQIQNILSFGKTCTFFLSRTDLRSKEALDEVRSGLEAQLSVLTGDEPEIQCISRKDPSLFDSFLHSLNVDGLFDRQFRESVIDDCCDTKSDLGTKISALKADESKNRKAVNELEAAIGSIREKKEKLIERAGNDSFSDEAEVVIAAVGKALNSELDSLVSAAKSGGSDALQNEIIDIAQSAVVSNTRTVIEKMADRFGQELGGEINGLDNLLSEYCAGGILDKFKRSARDVVDAAKTSVDSYIDDRKSNTDASIFYKTITGILSASTHILRPLVEVIVILIPDIFSLLFGSSRGQKSDERLRENIASRIPTIKRQLRGKVVEILRENGRAAITEICKRLDSELGQKKQEIEEVQRENSANIAEISAQIEKCSSGVAKIDALLAEIRE